MMLHFFLIEWRRTYLLHLCSKQSMYYINIAAYWKVSAPGPLGLTNNLLKEIVTYMLEVLTDLGNKIFFDEVTPELDAFFFHRMVVFILKPGKICTDPDSYRGLSMLEGFFKIYSKILANRIQKPLRQIQNEQQFGFTKNKVCLEASRTVIDVILHAKRNHLPLIIISTDFYKAFDSIAHCHIQACLEVFQFPSCFTFNLVVVPLNHYLATSPDVPRY